MNFKLRRVKGRFGNYEEIALASGERVLLSSSLDPKKVIAAFLAKKLWVFVILQENKSHHAEIQIFKKGAGVMQLAPAFMSALPQTTEPFVHELEEVYSYIGSIGLPFTNGPDAEDGWINAWFEYQSQKMQPISI